jgi:flagellum-specific ATP synthase
MIDFSQQVDEHIHSIRAPRVTTSGKLVRVVGLTLEAKGITAPLGAHCQVERSERGTYIDAEVVGFQDDLLYLMPFTEPSGIGPGARIWVRSHNSKIAVGNGLLGRVVDGLGQPIDGKGPIGKTQELALSGIPLNPMERGPI